MVAGREDRPLGPLTPLNDSVEYWTERFRDPTCAVGCYLGNHREGCIVWVRGSDQHQAVFRDYDAAHTCIEEAEKRAGADTCVEARKQPTHT